MLFDDAYTLPKNAAGTVRYHRDGSTEDSDTVTAWSPVRTLKPGNLSRQSWDYKPTRSMIINAPSRINQGTMGNQFAVSLDDYLVDVPHAGNDYNDYRQLGEMRMRRHEYESKCFYGESSVRALRVGEWIALTGHREIDTHPPKEREFIVTRLDIDAENNLPKTIDEQVKRLFALNRWDETPYSNALQQASEERGMRYTNRFSCVRRGIPIVPEFDPRSDLPRPQLQSCNCGRSGQPRSALRRIWPSQGAFSQYQTGRPQPCTRCRCQRQRLGFRLGSCRQHLGQQSLGDNYPSPCGR